MEYALPQEYHRDNQSHATKTPSPPDTTKTTAVSAFTAIKASNEPLSLLHTHSSQQLIVRRFRGSNEVSIEVAAFCINFNMYS